MSITGISSSNFQNNINEIQQEFQQLGKDLQSGNLSAAQSDFATLQQEGPQSSSAQSNNPIAQEFQKLAQDLKSGNLSAAQQDYKTIQQAFQNRAEHFGSQSGSGGAGSEVQSLFSQLGTQLNSGDLSSAQQTYNSLLNTLQQSGFNESEGSVLVQHEMESWRSP